MDYGPSRAGGRLVDRLRCGNHTLGECSIMKFILAFLRKPLSKFGQLYYESKGYADSLGDLMANLHFMSDKVDAEVVLVLVPSRSFRWYLRMLQSLGLVARISIVVIRSNNQLAELLVKLPANDEQLRLIFARKLYFRFYTQLRESEFEQSIIII